MSRRFDSDEVEKYINDVFIKKDLISCRYDKLKDSRYHMQISPLEAQILQMIIKMNSVETIIEIGALFGCSSISMAQAVGKKGKIYSIEKSEEHSSIARDNIKKFGLDDIVTIITGDAYDILNKDFTGSYDMIFIDGNKRGYPDYIKWADNHIKSGGIIVLDNTLCFGAVIDDNLLPKNISKDIPKIMNDVNTMLAKDERYITTMIPTKEGMTVALKL